MRAAGLLLLAALFLLSLFTGVSDLTPGTLFTADGWMLLRESRFPRSAAAVLAGAGLAMSGQIMQLLARNRFVEPMTAGAGQSAALGILLCVLIAPAAAMSPACSVMV